MLSPAVAMEPGETARGVVVGETYDPHRWMETPSAALEEWLREQHEHTVRTLAALPARAAIEAQLRELHGVGSISIPISRGGRRFYWQRAGGQSLPVLYVEDEAGGNLRVLLDQNGLSVDHTLTVGDTYPSFDGALIAYRLSQSGSSRMSLHVLDVARGTELPDVIPAEVNPVAHSWPSANRVAWTPDATGFY